MLSHLKKGNHSITINHDISIGINQSIYDDEQSSLIREDQTNSSFRDEYNDINLDVNLVARVWLENCSSPLSNIHLDDSRVLGGLLPLGLICLVVIIGNVMVMYAVKMTKNLRGATYLFIVSLGKHTYD